MKIALCKSHFFGPVSGADETLVSYAIHLHEAGCNVNVVLLYKPLKNDPFQRRLQKAGVPVSHIIQRSIVFAILRFLRNVLSSLFVFFLLIPRSEVRVRRAWQVVLNWISRCHYRDCYKYFSGSRFDLLHVFTPDTGAAMMIRAGHETGKAVLYHEMGTPNYLPALNSYYQRLERVLPFCTEVAALSPRLATQWLVRFPFLNSVSVLPLVTHELITHRTSIRVRLNKETTFGYAARIEAGKGPLDLVDASAQLRDGGVEARVRMAGIGPAMMQVKERVRELRLSDSWEFLGAYSGELARGAFMRTLDVFVLPSLAEGTSKSVIEAMAHGLPIIATDVGGLPDLVTAECGVLVQPGDSAALADAMKRLASDPDLRASMGRAARERYLSLFSPSAVLPLLTKTYSRLSDAGAKEPIPSRNGAHPWEPNGSGKSALGADIAFTLAEGEQAEAMEVAESAG